MLVDESAVKRCRNRRQPLFNVDLGSADIFGAGVRTLFVGEAGFPLMWYIQSTVTAIINLTEIESSVRRFSDVAVGNIIGECVIEPGNGPCTGCRLAYSLDVRILRERHVSVRQGIRGDPVMAKADLCGPKNTDCAIREILLP